MRRGTAALLGGVLAAMLTAAVGAQAQPTLAEPERRSAERIASEIPPVKPDLPVALIADNVEYDSETGRVVASGNVEVYQGERTLTAERIVYDSRTDTITAEGEIVVRDPSGITVYADFAELGTDLRAGLVRGARSVMGEDVKLSAVEARRVEGRYNTLSKAVYSPCKVCPGDPTPLWRIRARRVIHDEEAKRIHYEDAFLDVFGVPVLWLPWFSHADPTVDRASGFLVPEFSQDSNFGFGVQVPYFWAIDDHQDLTFSPFFTTDDGVVGVAEYRRAFSNGTFRIAGSGTRSDFTGEHEFNGHIEAEGRFDLENHFFWGFEGKAVTEDGFLRRFDFSDEDRLTSELFLRRYREDGFFDLTGVYFQSLRDEEPDDEIPAALPDFEVRQEVPSPLFGGTLGFSASSRVLLRDEGTDSTRLSFGADWDRQEVLPSGLVLRGFAEARGDVFITDNLVMEDSDTELRLAPLAGVEARFPLISEGAGGVAHVLEPIAQGVLAPYDINEDDQPNEDSRVVEFDDKNLFDRSRFPGADAFEEGPRLSLGLKYELITPGRLGFDAALGRVLRPRDADEFSSGSGLDDPVSDWVGAWALRFDPYTTVRHRFRVDDDFSIERNEIDADFALGPATLSVGYIFLDADPEIEAPDDREEVTGRASYRFHRNWTLLGMVQRDLEEAEFVETGAGLAFENECCRVELSVKRDFTDSDDSPDSTTVSLQVRLFTLGNNDYRGRQTADRR